MFFIFSVCNRNVAWIKEREWTGNCSIWLNPVSVLTLGRDMKINIPSPNTSYGQVQISLQRFFKSNFDYKKKPDCFAVY